MHRLAYLCIKSATPPVQLELYWDAKANRPVGLERRDEHYLLVGKHATSQSSDSLPRRLPLILVSPRRRAQGPPDRDAAYILQGQRLAQERALLPWPRLPSSGPGNKGRTSVLDLAQGERLNQTVRASAAISALSVIVVLVGLSCAMNAKARTSLNCHACQPHGVPGN